MKKLTLLLFTSLISFSAITASAEDNFGRSDSDKLRVDVQDPGNSGNYWGWGNGQTCTAKGYEIQWDNNSKTWRCARNTKIKHVK